MIWAAVITLSLVGFVAVAAGVRGRRINDHPICRGCGFDLVGLAGGAGHGNAGGGTDLRAGQWHGRCPECGRALTDRRIRTGARRRRRGLLALGALLLLIAAGWGGGLGWSRATAFDWNTVKPTWLLMVETRQPTGDNADAGMQELAARLNAGRLSTEQIDALIARILAVQGDAEAVWHASWGDFIEGARAHGALSDDELLRYAKQAVQAVLEPIEPRAHGARLFYGLSFTRPPRAGTSPGLYLQPMLRICRIDGVERDPGGSAVFMGLTAGSAGSVGGTSRLSLDPGEHEWELVYDMNIIDEPAYDEIEPLVSWRVTYTGSLTVGGQ